MSRKNFKTIYKNKKILGVITARGGSKGVPKKNIKLLKGKPLIAYSILQAQKSKYIDKVLVSTDDKKIAEISKKYGAEIQMRPEEFARDNTPHLPVLQYVVKQLEEEGYKTDIIVLLQPTSPFRANGEIDKAIKKFMDNPKADSLTSVSEVPGYYNPLWVKRIENNKLLPFAGSKIKDIPRRQDLPKFYWKSGQIYIMKYNTLMKKNSLFGDFCMPYIAEIKELANIDSKSDFALAEFIIDHLDIKFG